MRAWIRGGSQPIARARRALATSCGGCRRRVGHDREGLRDTASPLIGHAHFDFEAPSLRTLRAPLYETTVRIDRHAIRTREERIGQSRISFAASCSNLIAEEPAFDSGQGLRKDLWRTSALEHQG